MSKAAVSASPPPSSSYVMMFSRTSSSSSGDKESRFWRRSDSDRALTAGKQKWGILRHWRKIGRRLMKEGDGGRSHRGNKMEGGRVEQGREEKIIQTKRWNTQRQNKYRRGLGLGGWNIISAGCMPPFCNWLWAKARHLGALFSYDSMTLIPYSQSRKLHLTLSYGTEANYSCYSKTVQHRQIHPETRNWSAVAMLEELIGEILFIVYTALVKSSVLLPCCACCVSVKVQHDS